MSTETSTDQPTQSGPSSSGVRIEFQSFPANVSPPPPSSALSPGPSTSNSSSYRPPALATSISQIESATSFSNDLYDEDGGDQLDGCISSPTTPDPEGETNRKFRRGWAASPSHNKVIQNSFQASTRSNESEVLKRYREEYTGRSRNGKTKTDQYKEEHPNRPSGARWKQQNLPAWQPVFRPLNVIGTFFGAGVIILAIGIFMLITMTKTKEVIHDYTQCKWVKNNSMTCAEVIANRMHAPGKEKCQCREQITIPEPINTPVYIYYSLDGFYQNHRRYVSSVSTDQLRGYLLDKATILKYCSPYGTVGDNYQGKIYAPCGAIANSFFTDRFTLKTGESTISIKEKDIAWITDIKNKFRNPPNWDNTEQPINWTQPIQELEGGYTNEHFIVWMRTAAFPSFRKLWGRIEVESIWKDHTVLPAGTYNIDIDYNYPTVLEKLNIPKKIIISNTSWLGGRNLFLPILYIVVGSLCVLSGSAFVLIVWRTRKNENKIRSKRIQPTTNYQTMSSTDGIQFSSPVAPSAAQ